MDADPFKDNHWFEDINNPFIDYDRPELSALRQGYCD